MTTTDLCHLLAYARDKRLGLTCLHALAFVHLHGEIPINKVARHIGITSAAMTGTADKLIAHGYLTRHSGRSDRRNIWLAVTPAGQALITAALHGPAIAEFAEAV